MSFGLRAALAKDDTYLVYARTAELSAPAAERLCRRDVSTSPRHLKDAYTLWGMQKLISSVLAGAAVTLVLLTSACSSESGAADVEKVDATEAVQLIEQGEHTVIDVRTPAEYASGHVDGADNLDVSAATFERQLQGLDRSEEYIVYCQSGNRSAGAAEKMADLGFAEVVDAGGILELETAGAPIVTGS